MAWAEVSTRGCHLLQEIFASRNFSPSSYHCFFCLFFWQRDQFCQSASVSETLGFPFTVISSEFGLDKNEWKENKKPLPRNSAKTKKLPPGICHEFAKVNILATLVEISWVQRLWHVTLNFIMILSKRHPPKKETGLSVTHSPMASISEQRPWEHTGNIK